jgi:hypothetical protein
MKTQQQQIVSQSSLKVVMEWASMNNIQLSLKDLCGITRVVEEYVENGYSKELATRLEGVDKHIQETYKVSK